MNDPKAIDDADLDALRQEYGAMQATGWQLRRARIEYMMAVKGKSLMLGELEGKKQHQAEGWCQALDWVLSLDQHVAQAWDEHRQRTEEGERETEEEGGTLGLHYEAAG